MVSHQPFALTIPGELVDAIAARVVELKEPVHSSGLLVIVVDGR